MKLTQEETFAVLREMGLANPELLSEEQIAHYIRVYEDVRWQKAAAELLEANKDNPSFLRKITHITNQMSMGRMGKAQAHQELKRLGFRHKTEAA